MGRALRILAVLFFFFFFLPSVGALSSEQREDCPLPLNVYVLVDASQSAFLQDPEGEYRVELLRDVLLYLAAVGQVQKCAPHLRVYGYTSAYEKGYEVWWPDNDFPSDVITDRVEVSEIISIVEAVGRKLSNMRGEERNKIENLYEVLNHVLSLENGRQARGLVRKSLIIIITQGAIELEDKGSVLPVLCTSTRECLEKASERLRKTWGERWEGFPKAVILFKSGDKKLQTDWRNEIASSIVTIEYDLTERPEITRDVWDGLYSIFQENHWIVSQMDLVGLNVIYGATLISKDMGAELSFPETNKMGSVVLLDPQGNCVCRLVSEPGCKAELEEFKAGTQARGLQGSLSCAVTQYKLTVKTTSLQMPVFVFFALGGNVSTPTPTFIPTPPPLPTSTVVPTPTAGEGIVGSGTPTDSFAPSALDSGNGGKLIRFWVILVSVYVLLWFFFREGYIFYLLTGGAVGWVLVEVWLGFILWARIAWGDQVLNNLEPLFYALGLGDILSIPWVVSQIVRPKNSWYPLLAVITPVILVGSGIVWYLYFGTYFQHWLVVGAIGALVGSIIGWRSYRADLDSLEGGRL